MANGNGSLNVIYKSGMAILLMVLAFLASRIYTEVNAFPSSFVPNTRFEPIEKEMKSIPKDYVSLERYKCDIEKIERSLGRIDRKLDRAFPHILKDSEP